MFSSVSKKAELQRAPTTQQCNRRVIKTTRMSFFRKVDLLVNPPLAIYFFTEMQSSNEKTRLQVERRGRRSSGWLTSWSTNIVVLFRY